MTYCIEHGVLMELSIIDNNYHCDWCDKQIEESDLHKQIVSDWRKRAPKL